MTIIPKYTVMIYQTHFFHVAFLLFLYQRFEFPLNAMTGIPYGV